MTEKYGEYWIKQIWARTESGYWGFEYQIEQQRPKPMMGFVTIATVPTVEAAYGWIRNIDKTA